MGLLQGSDVVFLGMGTAKFTLIIFISAIMGVKINTRTGDIKCHFMMELHCRSFQSQIYTFFVNFPSGIPSADKKAVMQPGSLQELRQLIQELPATYQQNTTGSLPAKNHRQTTQKNTARPLRKKPSSGLQGKKEPEQETDKPGQYKIGDSDYQQRNKSVEGTAADKVARTREIHDGDIPHYGGTLE